MKIVNGLVTLQQTDLQVIIVYSSVSHLGVCNLGVFANDLIGNIGSLSLCYEYQ